MFPPGYQPRDGVNSDREAVRQLVHNALREYGLTPDPDHADRGLEDIEASFQDGWFKVLLSPEANIVGCVGLLPLSETTCELVKMFLAPDQRGRGLGKALMDMFLKEARAAGYQEIELETDTSLKEAVQLYQKYGFRERNEDNKTPRCNMVMTLSLS
jgi:putative acetyltransferase